MTTLRREPISGVTPVAGNPQDGSTEPDRAMNVSRNRHLQKLLAETEMRMSSKYRAGQKEHGGDLWTKGGIVHMAIEEAIDQLVYLLTLKEQLDEISEKHPDTAPIIHGDYSQ